VIRISSDLLIRDENQKTDEEMSGVFINGSALLLNWREDQGDNIRDRRSRYGPDGVISKERRTERWIEVSERHQTPELAVPAMRK